MFIYKYSQLNKKISYNETKQINCGGIKEYHIGQLKLLISEIMFLTKKSKPFNKVLYVGAAEGYHIAKLADMFPNLIFDLWDPGKFCVDERNNINIFNNFFTNANAASYKNQGNNILFISDIRTLDIAKFTKEKNEDKIDQLIEDDNNKQLKWIQIIKPIYAFLKFRPPYRPGMTKYLNGTIYLQCYSPSSTETRLLTNNYNDLIEYNNTDFDEKLAYFNCFIRNDKNLIKWKLVMEKYNIKNIWDNNYAFYVLYYYLDKMGYSKSDDDIAKLFNEIIKFLQIKYPKKYDYLFHQYS